MWETRTESEALCANVGEDHSQPNTSTSPSAAGQSPSPTSKEPYPSESMPSDGYHNMGDIDGKDWGAWQSDGASGAAEACHRSGTKQHVAFGADRRRVNGCPALTCPRRVAAAAAARLVSYEHPAGGELVAARAVLRRPDHPRALSAAEACRQVTYRGTSAPVRAAACSNGPALYLGLSRP